MDNATQVYIDIHKKFGPLMDKYRPELYKADDVSSKVREKVGHDRLDLTDGDRMTLAVLYHNMDDILTSYREVKLPHLNDTEYSAQVGPFRKHAFDIITAMITTLQIKDLISVQPLLQKKGAIYKTIFEYGTDKRNIKKGDLLFKPGEGGKRSGYYSSPIVEKEPVVWTFASPDSDAFLARNPLKNPMFIKLTVTGGAAEGVYTYLGISNQLYTLQKDGGGSQVGTVDPSTGAVKLAAVDATGATGTTCTYYWDSERFTSRDQIPTISVRVEEKDVIAERRQLALSAMYDLEYDYTKQFKGNILAQMQSAVVQMLSNETAGRILQEMRVGASGGVAADFTFDLTPTGGLDLEQHSKALFKLLAKMAGQVRTNVGRGTGNKIVTGGMLEEYLKVLTPQVWKRAVKPPSDGPCYLGKLNGDYDVYLDPDMPRDEFFMTYKGPQWWEAAYYMGTYLPLMKSKFMMFSDFHSEAGYLSMEAYEYEYPNMVVPGKLTETVPE
jgi:hypothetical protein